MADDRRTDPRIRHYFDCRWYGKWGGTDARLDDLSAGGCHVVNRFTTPSMGEIVEIEIIGATSEPLALSGEVVDVERGVGFAVRFGELDADTRDQIQALLTAAEASNRRLGQS